MPGRVRPVLHKFPTASLDCNVTLLPTQNVVGPLAVIVGLAGKGFTVTITSLDKGEGHPLASVMVKT